MVQMHRYGFSAYHQGSQGVEPWAWGYHLATEVHLGMEEEQIVGQDRRDPRVVEIGSPPAEEPWVVGHGNRD